MLRIHNTLSGQLEEFRPLVEGEVKFYYCGPTVWDLEPQGFEHFSRRV